jgi:hypothetical protein
MEKIPINFINLTIFCYLKFFKMTCLSIFPILTLSLMSFKMIKHLLESKILIVDQYDLISYFQFPFNKFLNSIFTLIDK